MVVMIAAENFSRVYGGGHTNKIVNVNLHT